MEVIKSDIGKNLVSIHYPGIVRNEERALDTLGGIRTISTTYSGKNRRLELKMRPEDVYCKPAFATRRSVTAIVLKIRVKKKVQKVLSCEVVGHVTEEYKFTSLCDFQFLPTSKTDSFYEDVVPRQLDLDWLKGSCPFFLQPTAFSRMDTVQNLNFSKVLDEKNRPNVIGRLKRKRYGYTKCVTFENPEVPDGPKNVPTGSTAAKIISRDTLNVLLKLFEDRPIYSKTAIMCISKLPPDQLKCLLPCVAYFFTNGPWRSLWVKFGYDPRKDPSARMYQTLDYRVKSQFTKDEKERIFKKKRDSVCSSLSVKFSNQGSKTVTVISGNPTEENEEEEEKPNVEEHIFKAGIIPPSRQCLYQYCDILVPEIQSMLEGLPAVDEQATCNEVHGWLPVGMSETCRSVMSKYVAEELNRRNEETTTTAADVSEAPNPAEHFSGTESESSDGEE